MIKLNKTGDISDDQKIIRSVDKSGLIKSIGMTLHGDIKSSFPLNLLSYYKDIEDKVREDKHEGTVKINIGGDIPAVSHTCNNALISCWEAVDNDFDPMEKLHNNKFKKENEDIHIICSTVGKVKKQVQSILDIFSHIHYSEHFSCIMNAIYGQVIYYPNTGISLSEWNKKTDCTDGVDMKILYSFFHKHNTYRDENEVRFALVLNNSDVSCSQNPKATLSIITLSKGLIYPEISFKNQHHYIDAIFSLNENLPQEIHPVISACKINTTLYTI